MLAPDSLRRRYLLVSLFFAAATVAVLKVDMPVARWVQEGGFQRLGFLDSLVSWSEVFAHGGGVGLILIIVLVLDPEHRRHVLRLGVLSLGAGGLALLAKFALARTRPYAADLAGTALATFHAGVFPTSSSLQSFPSGHTTTAVGLAIGLGWLYPRGRWMFYAFALLATSQRWANRDHFVSDSCAGAAIALGVAAFVLGGSRLQQWFDRFEREGDGDTLPTVR